MQTDSLFLDCEYIFFSLFKFYVRDFILNINLRKETYSYIVLTQNRESLHISTEIYIHHIVFLFLIPDII